METHSSTKLRNDDCGCKDIIFSDSGGSQEKRFFVFPLWNRHVFSTTPAPSLRVNSALSSLGPKCSLSGYIVAILFQRSISR